MTKFKDGFLWGNSVSSMQTEGAWNEDGKGMSVYDVREATENTTDWKVGIDSYHRYQEDFDMMKRMGMNCYRFQISWSRVNPDGDGEFNEKGIAFYDKFIDDLIAMDIEPMICLYHFDMPLNLAKKYNGFVSREVVDAFVVFGKEMLKRFGHKVKYWITFNEQNLYGMKSKGFKYGGYLEGEQTLEEHYYIQHHLMMAHTYFANYLHDNYPNCLTGGMVTYIESYPATCKPEDIFMARELDEFMNHNTLEAFTNGKYSPEFMAFIRNNKLEKIILPGDLEEMAKMKSDFLSFSYYASRIINSELVGKDTKVNSYLEEGVQMNPYLEATEWDWQIDPLAFRNILTKMYNRYKLPLFPIENGIGVMESWDGVNEIQDNYRIAYHKDHIQAMKDAVHIDGVDVIGYLGWGLIDIPSSQGDMRKRYGMVYVNRENHDLKDLKRTTKKSFWWFKKVIETNGEEL